MHTSQSIGIVGAGIAGLQLTLRLHQSGISTTLYTDRTPDQILAGRLPNSVCRFAPTRERERALGVDHWDDPRSLTTGIDFHITGTPIAWRGSFTQPASFVDTRLYQATLLEDVLQSGTRVVNGALQPENLEAVSRGHALMVIASGRGRLSDMFPRMAERSPYAEPQRKLFAGLFHGISPSEAADLAFCISPGNGEVFAFAPFVSFDGPVAALLVEAIPGGDLEPLTETTVDDLEQKFLGALRVHAPAIVERIDASHFELTRPQDMHRGTIIPVVRPGHRVLDSGCTHRQSATRTCSTTRLSVKARTRRRSPHQSWRTPSSPVVHSTRSSATLWSGRFSGKSEPWPSGRTPHSSHRHRMYSKFSRPPLTTVR
jgi:hypothetical protein